MGTQLGIIGGGNMGSAILSGALAAGVLRGEQVLAADPDAQARARLKKLGCRVTADSAECVGAEQLLLAIKPQRFEAAAEQLTLTKSMVVISIMAGLSSRAIRAVLGDAARVVRAMPNTPARVHLGMTALAMGEGAQPGDDALARKLFESVGQVLDVDEDQMYAVTAVSGSGPAYVFLLAEAMQQGAEQIGLSHAAARTLVKQTVRGAGELLSQSELNADALRQAVTSPGGTTAAALEVMFEKELPEIITEAILAARDRGMELDQGE